MIRKLLVTLTGLAALTAVGMAPASAATARSVSPRFTTEFCAQAGTGYCLNDWGDGGSGAAVRMDTSGLANDYFEAVAEPNYYLNGYEGFAIVPNGHTSLCVGTDGSGNANLGGCPPYGGGGTGSNVWYAVGTCNVGGIGGFIFVNGYWTNKDGTYSYLLSGGSVGGQAKVSTGGGSCWAEIG